jgi:signal transduction histidine kinase
MEQSRTMRWARWITPLWPGLTQLWLAGSWWGLAVGCSFAWLASFAIVSTLLWTEWIDPWSRLGVWVLLGMVWLASATLSIRQLLGFGPPETAKAAEDLFRQAQREYLNGNWIRAEQLLTQLLGANRKDVDAHFMMASLLRRTGQLAEATQRLRQLEAMDGAEKWKSEIARERKLLDELLKQPKTTTTENELTPQLNSAESKNSATKAA